MVAMTTSGASCGAEDIKEQQWVLIARVQKYCLLLFPLTAHVPVQDLSGLWRCPEIIFCCCPLHTLGIVMHILGLWWILITGPICSEQDPKCAMGLHQNVSGHHGSFWEKKTPKDGLGQGQTCEKRSTEQHFCTTCNKDPLLI
jgi:hypothetical protein